MHVGRPLTPFPQSGHGTNWPVVQRAPHFALRLPVQIFTTAAETLLESVWLLSLYVNNSYIHSAFFSI